MARIERRTLAEKLVDRYLVAHVVEGQAGHGLDWIDVVRVYTHGDAVFERECRSKDEASTLYFTIIKSIQIGGIKSLERFNEASERVSELLNEKEKTNADTERKQPARASRKPRWQANHN